MGEKEINRGEVDFHRCVIKVFRIKGNMELTIQRQGIGWQGQLPKANQSSRWSKKVILLALFTVCCLFLPSVIVIAGGFGGLASEKLIGRASVIDSQLLIGRSGVDNSNLDIGLGTAVSTLSAVGVLMDAGGTKATLRGNVSDLNGFSNASVWFEWGYDTSYGNTVGVQTVTAVGTYTSDIAHFQPDRIVYYRFVGDSGDGINYGSTKVLSASGTSVFNLMSILVPILFVVCLIVLLLGLINSKTPLLLMIIIGGVAIYMGINFLKEIVVTLQNLW